MRADVYDLTYALEDDHWWYAARRRIILERLETALRGRMPGESRRILDVGCGTGAMIREYERLGAAHGLDASDRALAYCRKRGIDRVERIDPAKPLPEVAPFGGKPFDVVSALDVLEHVEDDRRFLTALSRWLSPAGLLVLTVPAYEILWSGEDLISEHRRRYTRRSLVSAVRTAGLDVLEVTYFNFFLFPLQLGRSLWWRARGKPPESDVQPTGRRLNAALRALMSAETLLLRHSRLPVGGSILCLARARRD